MKNLFAVLVAVFFMLAVSGCEDSVDATLESTSGLQEDATSVDAGASSEDVTLSTEDILVIDDEDQSQPAPEEDGDHQALPSDPTENPGEEASYYEFPAWHIPPQS